MEGLGVDGTPAWAYDQDGYCVCCGFGRWKHHGPDCELRDALDLLAAVREVIKGWDPGDLAALDVPDDHHDHQDDQQDDE